MFSGAKPCLRYWERVTQGSFLRNYFEIRRLAYEDMSFKGFSIFSSGGHFVQWGGTILAILVEGHPRDISVKLFLKSVHLSRRRCHLSFFSIFSSSSGAEPLKQFWCMVVQETFL